MIALIVVFLLLVVVVVILSTNRTNPPAINNGKNADGTFSVSSCIQWAHKTWWMGPFLLWVLFWLILYLLYPLAWNLMWGKQSLYWISQIIYAGFVYRGKNKKLNRFGEEHQPMYQSILGFTVVCLFLIAVWREAARPSRPTPNQQTMRPTRPAPTYKKPTIPTVPVAPATPVVPAAPTVPDVSVPSNRLPPKPVRREPQNQTFTLRPHVFAIVTVPAGYHVSHIDDINMLYVWQKEEADGTTTMKIHVRRGYTPVQVTLYYEANER